MKRQFTLLLASVLVVFALTACGGNDKDTNQDNNGQNTVGEDIQNAGEDIMDAGEDVLDPDNNNNNSNKDNGTGDHKNDQNTTDRGDSALTGGDTTVEDAVTKQNSHPGVSYGQMLRNARVHDSDGLLTDHENAASGRTAEQRTETRFACLNRKTARRKHTGPRQQLRPCLFPKGLGKVLAFSREHGTIRQSIHFVEKEPL